MKRNIEVINKQTNKIKEVIGEIVPYGSKYALLDFPDYLNVGDSAIWLGSIDLLYEVTGNMPSYVCKLDNFKIDVFLLALPEGLIFLQGGGNFGDIWPQFQKFREMIIDTFHDRMIIQLPQTISFRDESAIKICANKILKHSNFQLFVRDQPSFNFAQKYFQCKVELMPDMAFGMGTLKPLAVPSNDVFMLLRDDSERAAYDRTLLYLNPNTKFADWLEEPIDFKKKAKIIALFKTFFTGSWGAQERRIKYYQQLALGRLSRGIKLLCSGKVVITDRLHAHILSTLLDIPHIALDNNYGKISSYIEAWTHNYPALQTAKTAEEALSKLVLLPDK